MEGLEQPTAVFGPTTYQTGGVSQGKPAALGGPGGLSGPGQARAGEPKGSVERIKGFARCVAEQAVSPATATLAVPLDTAPKKQREINS